MGLGLGLGTTWDNFYEPLFFCWTEIKLVDGRSLFLKRTIRVLFSIFPLKKVVKSWSHYALHASMFTYNSKEGNRKYTYATIEVSVGREKRTITIQAEFRGIFFAHFQVLKNYSHSYFKFILICEYSLFFVRCHWSLYTIIPSKSYDMTRQIVFMI